MRPLDPPYGDTPLSADEADALLPEVRELLGDVPAKADIYALEQPILEEVTAQLLEAVVSGGVGVPELFDDLWLFDLHRRLYGDIWAWAGAAAIHMRTIGIDPALIRPQLRESLDNILYRWQRDDGLDPRELGLLVHAETARIHPFVDGNGRTTRLLGNLVFAAAQDADQPLLQYDWNVDKSRYIDALRNYDSTLTVDALIDVVPVIVVE